MTGPLWGRGSRTDVGAARARPSLKQQRPSQTRDRVRGRRLGGPGAAPSARGGFPSSNRLALLPRDWSAVGRSGHGPRPGPLAARAARARGSPATPEEMLPPSPREAEGGNARTRIRGGAAAPRAGRGPAAGAAALRHWTAPSRAGARHRLGARGQGRPPDPAHGRRQVPLLPAPLAPPAAPDGGGLAAARPPRGPVSQDAAARRAGRAPRQHDRRGGPARGAGAHRRGRLAPRP